MAEAIERRADIPLAKLHESPFNKRRVWGDVDGIAASMREHGVLENLYARPHPTERGQYELVFGHRRFRAAKLAELKTVPCVVRELTDAQVVEAQCIENGQRQDVHPLDEAESFEQLMKVGKATADEVAAKLGKSRSHVFQRLKLLSLCEKVRKAFAEDQISASVALCIARIPGEKLQLDALKEMNPVWRQDPIGAREALRIVQERFMLRLADAPFDRGDATLVASAGTCAACPKRTGNQAELFADVSSADICTDPNCFAEKKSAHTVRLLKAAKKEGKTVLEGKAGEQAVQQAHYSGSSSKFVDLDQRCYEDPKSRTYRALLKKADVPVIVAKDARGAVHELVPRADVAKAIKSVVKIPEKASNPMRDDEKKRRLASERKRVKTLAIVAAIVGKAEKKVEGENFWPFLAALLIPGADSEALNEIVKRRGLVLEDKKKVYGRATGETPLLKALESMTHVEAKGLAMEVASSFGGFCFGSYGGDALGKGVVAAAKYYAVDVTKVGAAAVAAATAAKAAKKRAPKKAAKAPKRGGPRG